MLSFTQINEATGFAEGDLFGTPAEVREYFSAANLRKRGFAPTDQKTLDDYAREVIGHGWHMAPFSVTVLEGGTPVSFGSTLAEIWHWLEGFKSSEPCTLTPQSSCVTAISAVCALEGRACSGTVRQVMDWIEEILEEGKAVDWE